MLDGHLFGFGAAFGTSNLQARYLISLSCIVGAILLALAIGASLYDRAHTSRLLASIPMRSAPSLLVTTNRMGPLVRHQVSHCATAMDNNNNNNNNTEHTTQQDLSPARHVRSTSDQHNSNGQQQQQNNGQIWHCQQASLYGAWQQPHKSPISNATPIDSTYEQFLQSLQTNEQASTNQLANQLSARPFTLKVPIYILCQLFLIQLLVLLMLISQNWWQNRQQMQQQTQPQLMLDPIAQITWLIVILFYYLISSFTCWLLVQFLKLNKILLVSSNVQLDQTARQFNSSSVDSSEHDLQSELTSSKLTPSSSQYQQCQKLTSTTAATQQDRYWNQQWSVGKLNNNANINCINKSKLISSSSSFMQLFDLCTLFLEYFLPLALSAICFWVSQYNWLASQINELTFVSSFATQLASWPLLLESTSSQVSLLIYLLPSVSVFYLP